MISERVPTKCERCGRVFPSVNARYCYQCRRIMSRERAKRIGLNRIGYEAYSKQQAEKKMSKEKQNELLINDVGSNNSKAISNEQIDEMARVVADAFLEDYSLGCDPHQYTVAERLYNANYRKQSEGEWIKHPASYECTACKEEFFVEGYAEDYDPITDWDLHFCPNCGAKMKGGAE